jgi:hypothetical protein
MSDVNNLVARIEGAITGEKERLRRRQQQLLREHLERQELLKRYQRAQARVVEITKPRLEALAKRAGERVKVTPLLSQTRRQATFEFRSAKAHITLTFSVAPDYAVKNVVVDFDLNIVPVVWKFDSHAEFTTPIEPLDADGLARWLDDRIVGFVELLIQVLEDEFLGKAEYAEDPIANVRFPKFAAGATLDHGGQTYFFIDDATKAEFAPRMGLAPPDAISQQERLGDTLASTLVKLKS